MQFTLRELGLVDAPTEPGYDNLTRLASHLIGSPTALVSIVDFPRDRQYFKSHLGLAEPWKAQRETPLSHSFCQHVVRGDATLIVDNAAEHPRLRDNMAIPDLGVMAYLGAPVRGPTGRPVGALCVIEGEPRTWTAEDIETVERLAVCVSDLIRLKAAMLTSERLIREQRDFTYAISHDLRSPANTVRMILGEIGLEHDRMSADAQHLLGEATGTIDRMGRQIEDVLTYSRSLGLTGSETVVAVGDLVAEVLAELRADIDRRDAMIDTTDLPVVAGDPAQIKALFRNLISNALKFARPGEAPVVHICSDFDPTAGEHRISVRDNGIGIAPEDQTTIFDLFSRLNLRDEYDGTGIGLALCRRIAENHGGSVGVRSDGTHGSVFTVCLPGVTA